MNGIEAGDTAYVIMSGALVLLMTPGLALFYGGMVGERNVLNTLMLSFVAMCLIGVQWVLFGYALAFGPGNSVIGGEDFYGAIGVSLKAYEPYGTNLPHLAFWWFQLTFAMITPALISGTVVGRLRMRAWILFVLIWGTVLYDPVAHWVWGAWEEDGKMKYGWMRELGVLDFAGGIVVHITSGFSALAAALVIGQPTKEVPKEEAHSLPLVFIGTALLWFGWNGFNGGSALSAGGVAALATVNTNVSACMGMLTWMACDGMVKGVPTGLGAMTGAVVGLATVTPAAGFIRPLSALVFGCVGALVSFFSVEYLKKDIADTLDCFFCHGTSGVVGTVLLGLFAETQMNPGGADGLFFAFNADGAKFFGYQVMATVVSAAWSFIFTYALLNAFKAIPAIGLRPSEMKEVMGMDASLHAAKAYALDDSLSDSKKKKMAQIDHVDDAESAPKKMFADNAKV